MSTARRGVSPTVAVELSNSLLNNKCSEVGSKRGTIVKNILRLNIYAFEPDTGGGGATLKEYRLQVSAVSRY